MKTTEKETIFDRNQSGTNNEKGNKDKKQEWAQLNKEQAEATNWVTD